MFFKKKLVVSRNSLSRMNVVLGLQESVEGREVGMLPV